MAKQRLIDTSANLNNVKLLTPEGMLGNLSGNVDLGRQVFTKSGSLSMKLWSSRISTVQGLLKY